MGGRSQLTPGGRQAQQIFLSPANGDGGNYSADNAIYQISFVLPNVNAFVAADYGLRLRGQISAQYSVAPTGDGGNDLQHVYLSPLSGLHGMIKSVVITDSNNNTLERVQNYDRLATHLVNSTSSEGSIESHKLTEAFVVGSLSDSTEIADAGQDETIQKSTLMYRNRADFVNQQRFSFQLETGVSKGKQDISLAANGGLTVTIELNPKLKYLFAPASRDAAEAERSISNVSFSIVNPTLEYTQVFINPALNTDMAAPGNALPPSSMLRGVAPSGISVYQSFADSMVTLQNSFNHLSFATGLPAVKSLFYNFLSTSRDLGRTDPGALDNFDLDGGQISINGERVSFFDRMSPVQMKRANYDAFGPWSAVSDQCTIDQRFGLYGAPLDTLSAGPNLAGSNRPEISFISSQQDSDNAAYTGSPISANAYGRQLRDSIEFPALMHAFFLGTRSVQTAPPIGGSAVL